MKKVLVQIALALVACCAHGQGTFQFDQQVSPITPPGGYFNIQPGTTGQSFVPTLSSVGFVQFYLGDPTQVQAPTLYVDLWSGSLGGTLLGQSDPITLSTTFVGAATFSFATPISVTPGITYFFQPIIQSGDSEQIGGGFQTYPNGTAYFQGTADPNVDLWFREGSIVPEPSSFSLALLEFSQSCARARNLKRNGKIRTIAQKEPCSEESPLPSCFVHSRPTCRRRRTI